MARLMVLLSVLSILFTAINAQSSICEFFGGTPLQCAICGYTPSSPVYCVAYNATFDDLPSGPLSSIYKNTAWPGFFVLPQNTTLKSTTPSSPTAAKPPTTGTKIPSKRSRIQNTQAPSPAAPRSLISRLKTALHLRSSAPPILTSLTLTPASPPNYAVIPAGGSGTMQFGKEGGIDPIATNGQYPAGSLHYFSYACSLPGTNPPVPAACRITVTGTCLPSDGYDFVHGPFVELSVEIGYTLPLLGGSGASSMLMAKMAQFKDDFAQRGAEQGIAVPQRCANYTFEATPVVVGVEAPLAKVDLLLDNIVYNTFSVGYH